MDLSLRKNYALNETIRKSYSKLTMNIFALSFENWYENGYWDEHYTPYSILDGDRVVANISVCRLDYEYQGMIRHYVQLGAVATEKSYRGKGLSRRLMEEVLKDFNSYDGIYLYANDTVLEFYPKFGFEPKKEYGYETNVKVTGETSVQLVPMKNKQDWDKFLVEKNKRKSLGLVEMQYDGLLMFYLSQFMQDTVYYLPREDAYVIAELDGNTLELYGVYAKEEIPMTRIFEAFGNTIETVVFHFVPKDVTGLTKVEIKEEDRTFFVKGEPLCSDMEQINSFPEISHT